MKKIWNKIPGSLKNKYAACIFVFIIWLAFFDKNDFYAQYRFKQQLNSLLKDKQFYASELEKSKADLNDLMSSPANLEKFAREKYLMKKDDEDIFVFTDK